MMTLQECETDMVLGYRDGADLNAPIPGANRSWSYRHGFANARDDAARSPRASADELRKRADSCVFADMTLVW